MKRTLFSIFVLVLSISFMASDAEAKRLGGGRSFGMQRQGMDAPRQAPVAAPQAQPGTTNPGMANAAPKRNWLGPLAGIAAGVGLAALFSHFGMGEGMGNFVMIALLGIGAVLLVKMLTRKASPTGPQLAPAGPYVPDSNSHFEGAVAQGSRSTAPAGFDTEAFLRVAKVNFIRLQAANDAGNLNDIREFTTPEMFAEIKLDIDDRKGASQQTDFVTLDCELLDVLTESNRHIASVRFVGMLRESTDASPAPVNEVWHLVKPLDNSRGWVVAGIQQIS